MKHQNNIQTYVAAALMLAVCGLVLNGFSQTAHAQRNARAAKNTQQTAQKQPVKQETPAPQDIMPELDALEETLRAAEDTAVEVAEQAAAAAEKVADTDADAPGPDENDAVDAGPEEDEDEDDYVLEEIVIVPFEMEGVRRISLAELDAAIKLPEENTADALLEFLATLESLEPEDETLEDEKSLEAFLAKIAAAKWDAGMRLLEMDDERTLAVQTLLGAVFQEPETYMKKINTLSKLLRDRGESRLAWQVEGNLLQLEASLIIQKNTKTDAEKQKLLVGTCASLISHVKKGLAAKLAENDDILMLAISLIAYGESLSTESKCTLYMQFAPLAKTSEDGQLQLFGVLMERAVARYRMAGKPLNMAFQTISGKTVKPKDFVGKTLAIYFWSPENDISLRELSLLLKFYVFYHEKGLEVLGVALGGQSDELDALLEDGAFPWETVVDDTTEAAAEAEDVAKLDTPAVKLGVLECPTMMLVGTDGKVVAAEMNLLELLAYLEKEYGAYEPAEEDADLLEEK